MKFFRLLQKRQRDERIASKLVKDLYWGGTAIEEAIAFGDAILPFLRKASNDFTDLNVLNAEWIAETLAGIRTPESAAILRELYDRPVADVRLVGSLRLAAQGSLPEPITEDCFLVKTVRRTEEYETEQMHMSLAIQTLGLTRSEAALPCLLDLLRQRNVDYGYHAYACEAVGRIGSSEAIPTLQECLISPDYYALPEAFRALIARALTKRSLWGSPVYHPP